MQSVHVSLKGLWADKIIEGLCILRDSHLELNCLFLLNFQFKMIQVLARIWDLDYPSETEEALTFTLKTGHRFINSKISSDARLESESQVVQSRPTPCDPMDFTVHGILQARILEWVAYPFSRGSSWPRNWTRVSCIAGGFFTSWAIRECLSLWRGK